MRHVQARNSLLILLLLCICLTTVYAEESAYRVGINDEIYIDVAGQPIYSTNAAVLIDGTISYPSLGSLYVNRMTLSEIKNLITNRLSEGYVKSPIVTVLLKKSASKQIYFYGEVTGTIPFEKDITVGKALILKGVDKEKYDLKIRRKGKKGSGYENIEVDIRAIMMGNSDEILLNTDDVLIVVNRDGFTIQGEVGKPGKYPLKDNITVLEAITDAGGITENGQYGDVLIRRKRGNGSSGYDDIKVDIKGLLKGLKEDIPLKPDDIIIVKPNNKFIIFGEVITPGEYVLEDDMTLGKAIAKAGWVTEDGLYGKIKIRRMIKDNSVYDDIKYDLKDVNDGGAGSLPIMPDDIVVVEKNKKFMIYGEINKIGEFDFTDDMTVFKAITIAGGFSKWGSPSKIRILRHKENKKEFDILKVNVNKVMDGDASADIPLKPGDIVIVSSSIL